MFIVGVSTKICIFLVGISCVGTTSTLIWKPDILSNLIHRFDNKYTTFLVSKYSPKQLEDDDVSNQTSLSATQKEPSVVDIELSLNKNAKTFQDQADNLSQSTSNLYDNNKQNYKCLIPTKTVPVFDIDCQIFKINDDVRKTSDILKQNTPIKDKSKVVFNQYYVLKVNSKHLVNYNLRNKLPIDVVEKTTGHVEDNKRFFSLSMDYKFDGDQLLGVANSILISYRWTKDLQGVDDTSEPFDVKKTKHKDYLIYKTDQYYATPDATNTVEEDVLNLKIDYSKLDLDHGISELTINKLHILRGINKCSFPIPNDNLLNKYHLRFINNIQQGQKIVKKVYSFSFKKFLIGFFNEDSKKNKFYILDNPTQP